MGFHFGSNVLAVSPPRFLSTPSLITGRAVWVSSPWLSVSTKQLNHQCVTNVILILNSKHSTIPATTKKIDSVPGENRAILSKVNPILTSSGFSYILTLCCADTQPLFILSMSSCGTWLFCISFFHQNFSCFHNIITFLPSFFALYRIFLIWRILIFLPVSHSSYERIVDRKTCAKKFRGILGCEPTIISSLDAT